MVRTVITGTHPPVVSLKKGQCKLGKKCVFRHVDNQGRSIAPRSSSPNTGAPPAGAVGRKSRSSSPKSKAEAKPGMEKASVGLMLGMLTLAGLSSGQSVVLAGLSSSSTSCLAGRNPIALPPNSSSPPTDLPPYPNRHRHHVLTQ